MAIENVDVKEAKETLLNRQVNNRVSARSDRPIVSNERAILINHAERDQVYDSTNNYINKSETFRKLGDDNYASKVKSYAYIIRGEDRETKKLVNPFSERTIRIGITLIIKR